jgi:hypothetical protein
MEDCAGLADWQQLRWPLLATATGGQLRQSHLWELVRRVAKAAGWSVGPPSGWFDQR